VAFADVQKEKDQQTNYQRSQTFDAGPDRGGGIERVAKSKRKKQTAAKAKKAIDKEQALRKLVADNPYNIRIPSGRIPRGIPYAAPINFALNISSPSRQRRLNESVKYFDELEKISEKDKTGRYTKDETGYKNYMRDRLAGVIDASGNPLDSRGDSPLIYDDYMDAQIMRKTPQGIMTQDIMEEEKSPTPQDFTQRVIYDAYGAKDGGRAEYRVGGVSGREYDQQPKQQKTLAPTGGGGTDASQTSFVPPPASGGSGIASINKTSLAPETNKQDMKKNIFKSILGFAGNRALNSMGVPTRDLQKLIAAKGLYDQTKDLYGMAAPKNNFDAEAIIEEHNQKVLGDDSPEGKQINQGTIQAIDSLKNTMEFDVDTIIRNPSIDDRLEGVSPETIRSIYDQVSLPGQRPVMAAYGGRIPAAFGGIMDTETGRRGYFLGSIKKAFKGVAKAAKKVLGSDLGKAALFAGLGSYGLGIGPFAKGGTFENLGGSGFLKSGAKKLFMGGGDYDDNEFNPFKIGIAGLSALPLLGIGTKAKQDTLSGMTDRGGQLIDPLTKQEVTPTQLRSNLNMAIEEAGDDPVKIAAINEAYPFLNLGQNLPYPKYGVKDGGRIGFSEGGWEAEWDEIYEDYKLKQIKLGEEYVSKEEFIDMHRDNNAHAQGGRIGAQEGGLMNLGGMEKDYRNEGGFVALGGEERADDVPARLSRNEFVFTADAVRGAGGGDIDRGAEIMENVMKNLEQGGKMSEESQGNAGAQEMFSVSERIGEVL